MTESEIISIAGHFRIDDTPKSVVECTSGHINLTYAVTANRRYILQKINTNVFRNPKALMENIVRVTDFIRQKTAEAGGDVERCALKVVETLDGNTYYEDATGCYRMYHYVEGATSYDFCDSPALFRKVGAAFGQFQATLSDFDASCLHESIPDFHNTVKRYRDFEKAVENDLAGRREQVASEIAFVRAHESDCHAIVDALADGRLPLRVTHNDTKLNNIMIDEVTGEGICVIDLDTIMPGSALYDFGDSIRFGASSAAEDETDLSAVYFREDFFRAYAEGFLEGSNRSLTEREIDMMPTGAKVITLETGIRFLTDYLNGDTYFRISYPQQNLDRARNQFALVSDIERRHDVFDAIIADLKK